jgi:hypothetical protein
MRKTRNVVMLSTEKANEANAPIGKYEDSGKLVLRTKNDIPRGNGYHLYFTAPSIEENKENGEEIKENDWCIIRGKTLMQNRYGVLGSIIGTKDYLSKYCQKVIATTNPELWEYEVIMDGGKFSKLNVGQPVKGFKKIPKIPSDFIEVFVKEQGRIEKVDVEYEEVGTGNYGEDSDGGFEYVTHRLKLNNNGSVKVYKIQSNPIEEILSYMVENQYNKTNPVLYNYISSFINKL